tara:strand:- start:2404 stop:2670 length:267 start_codon:yes stop_codon:yes gene_type:complete
MFSFENRNKVLPIISNKQYILFNPITHKSKPQPKATILNTPPKSNISYPKLIKNKYVDDDGLVKDKILLTQYSKTLNNNHYSKFFTSK